MTHQALVLDFRDLSDKCQNTPSTASARQGPPFEIVDFLPFCLRFFRLVENVLPDTHCFYATDAPAATETWKRR